ncbi:MAG: nodulation protein NfeD, partial [Candidatus Hydrothermarchaeota archaeon]|nr:nodulation protein NfeD [Candidatus Hydrothermarchaeota archaeon]
VARGIQKAIEEQKQAVIIQMDTPGGLDTAMREIIQSIQTSEIPVVIYVYPNGARAASAGSFIAIASHAAAMAPATNLGAAHPVAMGAGGDVGEKVVNDATAYMRSLAEQRGRNVSLAASFVTNSTSITAREALDSNIIDIVAEDYTDLLGQLDGFEAEVTGGRKTIETKGAILEDLPMSSREEFLHIISNPNIAYILFLAGIYGIIFELSNPGAILPGVIGGIALLLAFWSFQAISINATGVALILFAILLFVLELKTQTQGFLSIGGIVAFFLGSIFLIDIEKEPYLRISLGVIIPATLLTAGFFAFAVGMAVRAHKRKPTTGIEGMVGLVGTAREELRPEGRIFVHGESWKARTKEEK